MTNTATSLVTNPSELITLLSQDRSAHVYGLCDLAEPFWSRSRWWRRGDAALGAVGLSDDPGDITVYAISPHAPQATAHLWRELWDELPLVYDATGPIGAAAVLSEPGSGPAAAGSGVSIHEYGRFAKMVLDPTIALAEHRHHFADVVLGVPKGYQARTLDQSDVDALSDFHYQFDEPGAFYHPSLLNVGPCFAIFGDDNLIATAGVHVCDPNQALAAIGGVLVHPNYRGQGLGTIVTAGQASTLIDLGIRTVGLNVSVQNQPALGIYRSLGFISVHEYEEIRIDRSQNPKNPGSNPESR